MPVEAAAEEPHERFQETEAILDAIRIPTTAIDPSFRIRRMNRAALVHGGVSSFRDGIGQPCYRFLHNRPSRCPYCPAEAEGDTFAVIKEATERVVQVTRPDGEELTLRLSFFPAEEPGMMAVELIQDITSEMERREEEARRENLAALGTMVSGIAHELNNPLTGMGLNLQGLLANLEGMDSKELLKRLQMIRKDLTRASQIVADILSFSRPGTMSRTRANLMEVIHKAKATAIRLYPVLASRIDWILEGDEDLVFTFNPEKIERLLVNLFKNSLQAHDYEPGFIRIAGRRVRKWIHVIVEDNAGGIPPAELKKVFNPFYTTTPGGRGSGLGLSICHSIAKQHRGRIRAHSAGGRTRFYLSLPVES